MAMTNWRSACGISVLAIGVASCSGLATTEDHAGASDVDIEPIIGGTLASDYPEAAFLNIDMVYGRGYACSGALIAPKVILTAGHCVDGHSRFDVYVGSSYRFSTSATTFDWVDESTTTVNPNHHDIGLVFLNTPVTLASYPQLSDVKLPDGTLITNVGRVLNGTVTASLYQGSTRAYGAERVGYPYDYVSLDVIQPGDSGGPTFVSGTHIIAAVNSGAGGGMQVLARVDLLADWIRQQIASHGGGGAGAIRVTPPSHDAATSDTGTAPPADASTAPPSTDAGSADAGTRAPPPDAGANPPSGDADTTDPLSDAGSKPPSTDAGHAAPPADAGSKPPSTDAGHAAPPADAGSKPPSTDAGHAAPPADAGRAPLSDAGSPPPSADAGSTAPIPDPAPSCTPELEPNNTFAAAMRLGHSSCGSISPATDVDWFYFDATPGVHLLRVASSSDAAMMIGVASGNTCVSTVQGLRSAKVKVFRGTQRLCVRIDSQHDRPQMYQVTAD